MQNPKFDRLIEGIPQELDLQELSQFKAYCSAKFTSLEQWIKTSMTLYKVDKQICYHFMIYISNYELPKSTYNDVKHQIHKIKIYNSLVSLTLGKAVRQSKSQNNQKWMAEARKYHNFSDKVIIGQKSTIITRAFIHYYNGEITKAANIFNKSYEQFVNSKSQDPELKKNLVVTIIGLAQTHFVRKNYIKALQLYKKALQINKKLPSKARIGMGYCFYFLNKIQLAEICFKRIIKLDSKCVDAYIALAIISDRKNKDDQYFKNLLQAYKLNSEHPLILLHLAEHFLFKGDQQKCKKMCDQGFKSVQNMPRFLKQQGQMRNDFEQYQARLNNIMGQLCHQKQEFEKAMGFYTAANGKGIQYNALSLSQIYMHPNCLNYVQAAKILQQMYEKLTPRQAKLLGEGHKQMAYLKSKIPIKQNQQGPSYYYSQALKHNKADYQSYIEFSNLCIQTKKQKALQLLLEAQRVLQQTKKAIKPELYNNIGVLYLENREYEKSKQYINKCFESLSKQMNSTHQQQLREKSIKLTAKFNLGIIYEKQFKYQQALEIYKEIEMTNKYFIDHVVRKSMILFNQGKAEQALKQLDESIQICESTKARFLRVDKLATMKAHILHLTGKDNKAKETLRNVLKMNKDVYAQFYEMCIQYENLMKRQAQMSVLKEFIRPRRQFCIKLCQQDPNFLFSFMALLAILSMDKKITKTQGLQYFNIIKDGQRQIPSLLYNMATFFFYYDDYENAITAMARFREKTNFTQVNEMLPLVHLIQGNYGEAIKQTKRNIMLNPKSAKHRFQLAFICEKKIEAIMQDKDRPVSQIRASYEVLKRSNRIYHFLSKTNVSQLLKNQTTIEFKDTLKPIYVRIKNLCDERKIFVKSRLDYYQRAQEEIERKAKQQEQAEKRALNVIRDSLMKQNRLIQQLMHDEDQQQKKQRELQNFRKQKALNKVRQLQEKFNHEWNQMKAIEKQKQQQKKIRQQNRANNPKKEKGRKRQKKQDLYDISQDDKFIEEKASESQQGHSASDQSSDKFKRLRNQQEDKQQRAEKKKIKKIKTEQKYSGTSQKQSSEEKKQSKKDQDDEMDQNLRKYMVDEQ